jgi:hypothetical protein
MGSKMTKQDLLKQIAETGYTAGFGAKRHFATYDILEKYPGWVSLISIVIGIFALIFDFLGTKEVSAALLAFGITTFYTNSYEHYKMDYDKSGKTLTGIFNDLKSLYLEVRSRDHVDLSPDVQALSLLQSRVHATAISKQLAFSNWYAHYKFFWEQQTGWVDEQLKFSFWRDKIPLSLTLTAILAIAGVGYLGIRYMLCGSIS